MRLPPADLTFEEWIAYLFDNPEDYRWFDRLADWGACPPPVLLAYLTRTCEEAETVLQRFSNAQLNQTFWFLVGESGALHVLFDAALPWAARQRGIHAIGTLFRSCFAPRCSPYLSHLDEAADNPLNSICYMWWDLFPTWGQPTESEHVVVDAELLAVLQAILALDADACRESALHGLGHWARQYPQRVARIIDAFLQQRPQLRPELRQYSLAARSGCIQ